MRYELMVGLEDGDDALHAVVFASTAYLGSTALRPFLDRTL